MLFTYLFSQLSNFKSEMKWIKYISQICYDEKKNDYSVQQEFKSWNCKRAFWQKMDLRKPFNLHSHFLVKSSTFELKVQENNYDFQFFIMLELSNFDIEFLMSLKRHDFSHLTDYLPSMVNFKNLLWSYRKDIYFVCFKTLNQCIH